eukprot:TRINITY_DN4073_c0_g1_i1.p2 TRINITY_DN4073_c0_g1~~TRINITY_DN4073_c0_g1_i1.p2  ORF type:complete len:119 (-),score=56.73 TRINITY_DN4073_c0_g1_i1:269-583(-)
MAFRTPKSINFNPKHPKSSTPTPTPKLNTINTTRHNIIKTTTTASSLFSPNATKTNSLQTTTQQTQNSEAGKRLFSTSNSSLSLSLFGNLISLLVLAFSNGDGG